MTSQEQVNAFYSIPQLYREGDDAAPKDLELRMRRWGHAFEFTLINRHYGVQKLTQAKNIAVVLILYGIFIAIRLVSHNASAPDKQLSLLTSTHLIDVAFILWLVYNIQALFALIKCEKLLFCLDFALQLQTERFMSRSTNNMFISANDIHDVVINEVIEDLDVHYVLIVRTKGNLFEQRPIIPIFNRLRPSVECLEMVYAHMSKALAATKENL